MKKPRRWKRVGMAELKRLWDRLKKANQIFNGCTHVALTKRYGKANLKHVMGHGWYKLV